MIVFTIVININYNLPLSTLRQPSIYVINSREIVLVDLSVSVMVKVKENKVQKIQKGEVIQKNKLWRNFHNHLKKKLEVRLQIMSRITPTQKILKNQNKKMLQTMSPT